MSLSDELNQLFHDLMADSTLSLYDFQVRTAMELLDGHSVILRAPTGGGKTWAALLPFLYAKRICKPIADRVLYALPLRSLASQLHSSTLGSCARAGWLVSEEPDHKAGQLTITLQTGERQNDPFFQGDIVFTTIDQLLSSYLLSPVSLHSRFANINAGALVGSLVVFDEFHLLDPDRSMATAVEMLDRLRPYCRFVLMTATLSNQAVKGLAQRLNAVVVDPGDAEIAVIEGKKKRGATERTWLIESEPLTAQKVVDDHLTGGYHRTLVLTNTVSRAQDLYEELLCKPHDVSVSLLHSRFYREDRANKEDEVVARLGKQSQDIPENFILVSTQVVEAGMDFSVDCIHTELAPANSLIQRAGRCARYGGKGAVKIYPVDSPAPYSRKEVERTLEALVPLSEKVFCAATERDVVNFVHGPVESEILRRLNISTWRKKTNLAMDGCLENAAEELIRDINSISVLITSDPEKIRFDHPDRWPEMLSVPSATLRASLKRVKPKSENAWTAAVPEELDDDSDSDAGLRFRWKRFAADTPPLAWLIVIHPDYARYTSDMGLRVGEAGQEITLRYTPRNTQQRYRYRYETMVQHIQAVLKEAEALRECSNCARRSLAWGLGVEQDTITMAEKLAVILHDVGKLSDGWQQPVRAWQKSKTGRLPDEPLAHSDYDPEKDWDSLRRLPKRSNHALEGAYACCDYLFNYFRECDAVASCIVTAIARHHQGHAKALGHFRLIPDASSVINPLLAVSGLPENNDLRDQPREIECGKGGEFAKELISASREEDQDWLPLYWHLVRTLRLADQGGSAKGGIE